jgi:hypothetical protein
MITNWTSTVCILNFIKIRWQVTEILFSKVLAETPVYIPAVPELPP